ncbi:MAG: hypothetical protein M1820_004077 [Bogoriella megaspora]|nr:MAG: hypothetical protein M1820_004077 [Bogoriella megaspora]
MASQIKPITLWGQGGPNPPKVGILLEELKIPHEIVPMSLAEAKNPDYVLINPNGRIPSIRDPNTGVTLWESGAIIEYLIDNYDKKHEFSFPPGTPEAYHAKQFLFFQTTGQGPYYGQAAWFNNYHTEKLPSAIERYTKEVNRVTGVLEGILAEQKQKYSGSAGSDGPWLVGNKLSFADLAFISYQVIIGFVLQKEQYDIDNFPHVKEWLGKMTARDAVKKVMDRALASR